MHEKVVIMEQDSSVQQLLVAILKDERYKVGVAETEQDVLKLFLKSNYEIQGLIMGINPGIEIEIDFIRTLKSWDHTKYIPVAVLMPDTSDIYTQFPDLDTLVQKIIQIPFQYHQFVGAIADLTGRESVVGTRKII